MRPKFLVFKLSCLVISSIFFTYCTKVSENTVSMTLVKTLPFTQSANSYLAMAEDQDGNEKQTMLIMAAGQSFFTGKWQQAEAILAQTEQLSTTQTYIKNILLAKIALLKHKPAEAIRELSVVQHPKRLSIFYQAQFHEALANTYELLGKRIAAVNERLKFNHLLTNRESHQANQQAIWVALKNLPIAELKTLSGAEDNLELQGWAKLVLAVKEASKSNLIKKVNLWQQEFLSHPANTWLAYYLKTNSKSLPSKPVTYKTPKQIALLLPISGPLAGPGNAIQDGFMAAYSNSKLEHEMNVRIYDTAAEDVVELYQRALTEGADYIVGPLTKAEVMKVAALEHPVPTLLLNDINTSALNSINNLINTYHFSLSPVDEAKQVAVKASLKGLNKVLIISLAGMWGHEVTSAFTSQWEERGGEVIDRLVYDNTTDLNQAIRRFLRVSQHDALEKQYKVKPGQEITLTSKRRQDFDMIFLLAYPSKARQIMPLLKYYFAGDIPVYATSSVYAGSKNVKEDKDLDGLIFCDMPWIFNYQAPNKKWPEQLNSYSRLYALGMDSYALSTQLKQLIASPDKGLDNHSGQLYLNNGQQILRQLSWGKFNHGIAQKLEI
ncbi:penicillin-binding protein activator [Legionella sp. D16C41]|uniref:penicillin-binding protein activator n=1 Tax=Legionella sp. D16C41 TaxID=3402688 RepID=UPI003AF70B4B